MLSTVIASGAYLGMGEAGYQPGVDTTAGIDAEQIRILASAICAVIAYVAPDGIAGLAKRIPAILGLDADKKIAALTERVEALEAASQPKKAAKGN